MHLIEPEYEGQIVHVDTHVSGEFLFAEAGPRGSRYGVSGIPHVQFDGLTNVTGAGSCNGAAASYRPQMNNRIAATGGVTPVDLSVVMNIAGGQVTVTGTAELVDNVNLSGLQMTLFVVENDITWCCDPQGGDHFDRISRGIRSNPITLTFGGGTVQTQETWALDSEWNPDNLAAVAVVERISAPREVYQSAGYQNFLSLQWDQAVASVPEGSGEALVSGTIINGNEAGDVFDLNLVGDQGGWIQEFQLDGDPTWYTTTTLPLAGGEEKALTLRVTTDASELIGMVGLTAIGQATSFSVNAEFRVFNGAAAVLFVDADNETTRDLQLPYAEALDALLPFYDAIVVSAGGGPTLATIKGYDLIVWETGKLANNSVSEDSGLAMEAFLGDGGNLLLSSMGFTTSPGSSAPLRTLLGVSTVTDDTGAMEAFGVPGDPVTDGMHYDLEWLSQGFNKCDTVNPIAAGSGTSAATIFFNEFGHSNAIRQETGGGHRTIFNTIEPEAFGEAADYDDEVVLAMISWLLDSNDPAAVGDTPFISSLLSASPNPFSPQADIQFALSDWAAGQSVSLKLVDASGRLVRTLHNGALESGAHSMAWDGLDDAGEEVANGLYFAVLDSADGIMKAKLMRLR